MKVIAESAFNHNGDLNYLKKLALATKKAQADYFTVQVMEPKAFCTDDYSKKQIYHQNKLTKNQWEDLFNYCAEIKLDVLPCALEEVSFAWCYEYGFRTFKLHGTDLTNIPFLNLIREKQDCKLILETQCATFQDIKTAIDIVGNCVKTIFHGFSDYPTEIEEQNLLAINALKKDFPGYKYGFADHTLTTKEIPLMALMAGYTYIEKHITLSRNNRNFDWQVSLTPEEFSCMVNNIKLYSKALGNGTKHPSTRELSYRNIIFKKIQKNNSNLKRSDNGMDYISNEFSSFSKEEIGIALIARLKSQRLKQKVLKPFLNKSIIEDLFTRLKFCNNIKSVKLATSSLKEDEPLIDLIGPDNSFKGHPISVLDRMLSLSRKEKLGGIFRVTGDNPFTDILLMEKMIELFVSNDLDYIRVNNVPFGVSAELFSTNYLWNLYLNIKYPGQSEYLSWLVLNDKNAKKGCINFIPNNPNLKYINLSIDLQEDYIKAIKLLHRVSPKSPEDIQLINIIKNLDYDDIMDKNKKIKLPEGKTYLFNDYLNLMNNIPYQKKVDIHENDLYNR